MPRLRGITTVRIGTSVGSAIVVRTNAVHTTGDAAGSVHPTTNVRKVAGADSVRRRLSIIFHRPINGIGRWEPYPTIHGSSCQSPRAHRCWRAAAAPEIDCGRPDKLVFVTKPAGAKDPSKESWLNNPLLCTRSPPADS